MQFIPYFNRSINFAMVLFLNVKEPGSFSSHDHANTCLIFGTTTWTSVVDIDIPPTNSSRGRRQRSKAWDHFVIIRDDNGKPVEAECKYCHTVVQCKTTNGTGVLSRHIKSAGCREMASHQQQEPSSR